LEGVIENPVMQYKRGEIGLGQLLSLSISHLRADSASHD
jgi:hypothetical protein